MHLARRYRLKFAAQRSDRFVLYLATAVAFHLGLMAVGIQVWRVEADQVATDPPQSIEFVYLEGESGEPNEIGQLSNIDTQAGGEHQSGLAIAAGKPEEFKPPEAESSKPLTPSSATGAYVPTYSQTNDSEKELDSDSVEKTEPTPSASPIPSQRAASGVVAPPVNPSPLPAKPEAPSPEPSLSAASPVPPLPTLSPDASAEPGVPSPGFGLDGLFNPDRTAVNRPGINTQRDEIWGDYIAALNETIYQHWRSTNPDVTRETLVRFEIDRQGRLVSEIRVTQSSGSDLADQAAIAAVENTAPFAPFPATIPDASVIINFRFTQNVRSPRR
ncbi:TonB family protein [Oscillatoria sp. FACHB-1407]|uniref:TonB family protein n=1 Tax=Oscillatoria sp. FACHB-1407 TaxID=2692847 RepID=UPI00168920B3|nr:TonB family protein [Oscillatoria sp. FACHB-1407]MBD2464883.1 TonB family protein [Oscillatoria sp. FACHB-1407]